MTDLEQQLLETWQHYLDERDSAIVQRLEALSAHVASLAAQLDGLSVERTRSTIQPVIGMTPPSRSRLVSRLSWL